MKLSKLPEVIRVKINKLPKGRVFVELTDLGVFTEADNENELDFMINDLIYSYFDVPKEFQKQFHYKPAEDKDFEKAKKILMYSTANFYRKFMPS